MSCHPGMRVSLSRLFTSLGVAALISASLSACNILDPKPPVELVTPEPAPAINQADQALNRAEALKRQGMLDKAREEFEKAIAINPNLTVAYLGAGDIYREQGDYKNAESRYSRAAQIEPGNFDAQYLHGLTLQLLNRLGEAVRAYLRALTIRPDDFSANLNLATAYLQLGEPAQALPYAQRAVKIDTSSGPARTNLGSVYAALGRHAEAVSEYQQASELADLTPPLLLNLADSLGKIGRYEEMVNTLTRLLELQPSAAGFERLGSAQFRLRKYPEAEAAFRKSIELDPGYFPALNGVAVCCLNRYVWSDKTDEAARTEAVDLFRRSLAIDKRQPKIVELLSRYQ
ncbi:MAG: tetratricopeptide repeat protein [Phycisphaerales bacterium]